MKCKKQRVNFEPCSIKLTWEEYQRRTLQSYRDTGNTFAFDKHVESLSKGRHSVNLVRDTGGNTYVEVVRYIKYDKRF